MAFRGRGRGRGGSRQYRTREEEEEDISSSEGLRITVPNVPTPADQTPALLYDDDAAVDKALIKGVTTKTDSKTSGKESEHKVPVKDRLGQPTEAKEEEEEEESLRITVGNERFQGRTRDPPQARLGPPVENKNGGKKRDSKERDYSSRDRDDHRERGDRDHRDRDDRDRRDRDDRDRRDRDDRQHRFRDERDHRERDFRDRRERDDRRDRDQRERDFHRIRETDRGHGHDRGRAPGGPDRGRGWSDRNWHRRDDRPFEDRPKPRSHEGSRDRSEDRDSRNGHFDNSRDRRRERSPGRDLRRSPDRTFRRSPQRDFRRSPQRDYRKSPVRDFRRSPERDNHPDRYRGDSWSREPRGLSPTPGNRPVSIPSERDHVLHPTSLVPSHALLPQENQPYGIPSRRSASPVNMGHPLKSILKRAQAEPVPSLPGAQVVDYGHGMPKTVTEFSREQAPAPILPTLTEVLGILRPLPPEPVDISSGIGMPNTVVLEPSGLPTASQVPNVGSAMDIEDEEKFLYGDGDEIVTTGMTENSNSSDSRTRQFEEITNFKDFPVMQEPEPLLAPYGKWDDDRYDQGKPEIHTQKPVTDVFLGTSAALESPLFPISTASFPISTASFPVSTASFPVSTASFPVSTASFPVSTASNTILSSTSVAESVPMSLAGEIPTGQVIAASVAAPKPMAINPEPSTVTGDPTIQNILKSIGFNFELSKLMQEKANKERLKEEAKGEGLDSFGINAGASFMGGGLKNVDLGSVFDSKKNAKEGKKSKILGTAESYEEKARRYREELARAKARGQRSPIPFDEEDEETDEKVRETSLPKAKGTGHHVDKSEHEQGGDKLNLKHSGYGEKEDKQEVDQKYQLQCQIEEMLKQERKSAERHSLERDSAGKHEGSLSQMENSPAVSVQKEVSIEELFSGRDMDYRQTTNYSTPPPGYQPQEMHPLAYQPHQSHDNYPGNYQHYHQHYGYEHPGYAEYGQPPAGAYSGYYEQEPAQGISRIGNLTVIAPAEEPAPKRPLSPEPEHRREIKIMKEEPSSATVITSSTEKSSRRTVLPPKKDSRDEKLREERNSRQSPDSRSNKNGSGSSREHRGSSSRDSSSRGREEKGYPSEKPKYLSDSMKEKLLREREEREKRLKALERELEKLRKQQNEMMRKRQRQKDGHKDPLLLENSKLQSEISYQIKRLRKLAEENTEILSGSASSPSFKSTFKETAAKKPESKSNVKPESRSTPDSSKNEVKSTTKVKDVKEDKDERIRIEKEDKEEKKKMTPKVKETMKKPQDDKHTKEVKPKAKSGIRFEYFDPGNHWCRLCNHVSNNVYEVFGHVMSKKHIQKLDPYDRPWVPDSLKKRRQSPKTAGSAVAPLKGVEFTMAAQAFFCTLCNEFSGDMTCAEDHLKSESHNQKYQLYLDENPFYERRMQLDKAAGVSDLMREDRKRTQDEEEPEETSSKRHKTSVPVKEVKTAEVKLEKETHSRKKVVETTEKREIKMERKDNIEAKIKPKDVQKEEQKNKVEDTYEAKDQVKSSKPSTSKPEESPASEKPVKPKVMPMTWMTLYGRRGVKDKKREDKGESSKITIKLDGKSGINTTKLNTPVGGEKEVKFQTPGLKPPNIKKPSRFSLWVPKADDYQEVQEENVISKLADPLAKLDAFLSIGNPGQDKNVPVIKEKDPMRIDKETAEELKILGIDPDSTATSMFAARRPPSLAASRPKQLTAKMAASTASNMYNVYYSDSSMKEQARNQIHTDLAHAQSISDIVPPSKWETSDEPSGDNDAASENSDVSMEMGDFEILDECED